MTENKIKLNRIPYPVWIFLILLNFLLVLFIVSPDLFGLLNSTQTDESNPTLAITNTPTQIQVLSDTPAPSSNTASVPPLSLEENAYLISLYVNQKEQIYIYQSGQDRLVRLFDSPYEESTPAISQDGTKLAYTAKKNGYWDLYVLDLENDEETRITDTAAYEGQPTWSPDGEFLAYTTNINGNLDIYLKSISDLDSEAIQLTLDEGADFAPSWSPTGNEIVFVSTRSGEQEIWLADLQTVNDRFSNISNRPDFQDTNPVWLSNGQQIAWSGEKEGESHIILSEINKLPLQSRIIGQGKFAQVTDQNLITISEKANQSFISLTDLTTQQLSNNLVELPGTTQSLLVITNPEVIETLASSRSENPSLAVGSSLDTDISQVNDLGRANIAFLNNINAPYPYLNEYAVSAFDLLRIDTATIIGWDFLNDLDNAYVPLTHPNDPGLIGDWLYTGRAIKFNPLTVYADLAAVIREDHDGKTYWRIYLKARYQDGSQGKPLMQSPWQLEARYNNDPDAYDAGGYYGEIPEGYWIDFTSIALDHEWQRVPAQNNWQQYFNGALFNQFIYTNGLDWSQAIAQLYPIESIESPTPIPTITKTPTFTPTVRFFRSPTITPTPTETPVPTRRPTWTPEP